MSDFVNDVRCDLESFREQIDSALKTLELGKPVDQEVSGLLVGVDNLYHKIRDQRTPPLLKVEGTFGRLEKYRDFEDLEIPPLTDDDVDHIIGSLGVD